MRPLASSLSQQQRPPPLLPPLTLLLLLLLAPLPPRLLTCAAAQRIALRDVSRAAGLDYSMGPRNKYGGPSIADLDDDGYPDLLFTHHDSTHIELYFNQRNGTFAKLRGLRLHNDTHALNAFRYLPPRGPTDGPAAAPVRFTVARGGAYGTAPSYVRVFRVARDRTLVEETPWTGLMRHSGRGRSAFFLPLAGPGAKGAARARTDLLSLNAAPLGRGVPHHVAFKNAHRPSPRGRPTVAQFGRMPSPWAPGRPFATNPNWYAAPVDFDNDGRVDVVSFQRLAFYRVAAPFRLRDVTAAVLPAGLRPFGVVAVAELDFDNDGRWDLYVATTRTGDLSFLKRRHRYRDYLLRNVGGRYEDVTKQAGIPQDGQTRGVTVADLDNDGRVDIVLTKFWKRSVVLRNFGGGRFAPRFDLPPRLRGNAPGDGAAAVDYDLDGRVDVVVAEGDGVKRNRGGFYRVLRNVSPRRGRHYLLVRVGTAPSWKATPLFAVVRVRVGSTTMMRRVGPSGVAVSISMIETLHFGLGFAKQANRVEVQWTDGTKKVAWNVLADRVLTMGYVPPVERLPAGWA